MAGLAQAAKARMSWDHNDGSGGDPAALPAGKDSLLRLGEAAFKAGRFEACVATMRQVLESEAGNRSALLYIARAERARRDWPAAVSAAGRLLEVLPRHENALEIAAEGRAHLGDWTAASGYYRTLTKLNRKRPEFLLGLARSLSNEGRWDAAFDAATAALKHLPQSQQALTLALRAAIAIGDIRRTPPLWGGLARVDPRSVIRWSRILARQSHFDWAACAYLGLLEGRGGSMEVIAERNWLVGFLSQALDQAIAEQQNDAAMALRAALALVVPDLQPNAVPPVLPPHSTDGASGPILSDNDAADAAGIAVSGEALRALRPAASVQGPSVRSVVTPPLPKPSDAQTDTRVTPLPMRTTEEAERRRLLQARFQSARLADRERRYGDVIVTLEGNEVLPKHRLDALKLLARSYWFSDNRGRSLEQWRMIVEISPEDAAAWLFIARGCKSLHLWQEGRSAAQRRLQLIPADAKAERLIEEFDLVLGVEGGRA